MSALPRTLPQPILPRLRGGHVLRWGIMSPGFIARRFTTAVLKHTDQRVVAVGSRSTERATAFAAEFGIESAYGSYAELVSDPAVDAVYIAAPHSEHVELGLLAIAAGKHVMIEKPIAVTAQQARTLRDAAAQAGVYLVEAMHSRFNPRTSVLEQLLGDGVLGDVHTVGADLGIASTFDPHSRLYNPLLAGGALLDIGVYVVWFCRFVLGEFSSVRAAGVLAPTGVDVRSVVALTTPAGGLASATTSLSAWTPSFGSINGTGGRVLLPSRIPLIGPLELYGPDNTLHLRYDDETGIPPTEGIGRQAAAMAEDLGAGRTTSSRLPLEESIAVLAVLDEARAQLGVSYPGKVEA